MLSGRFKLDYGEFCEELKLSIRQVALELREEQLYDKKETTAWTTAVKQVLKRLGDEQRYQCLYSLSGHDCSEFLLDFVWWYRGADGDGAILACESEFLRSTAEIGKDFDKLLSFKAPVKLMIFATEEKHPSLQNEILTCLTDYMTRYAFHMEGETYILIDLCPSSRAWILPILKSGTNPAVRFEALN